MINSKKVLGLIPARGGSKGIPRKNLVEVQGKPLLAWTIEHARESNYIDDVILSSEDDEIIGVAKHYGCDVPFVRPNELATDESGSMDVVSHALEALPERYDYIVLLQVTSPLRRPQDIDACLEACENQGFSACVSVCEVDKSPFWMYTTNKNGLLQPIIQGDAFLTRRQDMPTVYYPNGAVYVAKIEWLFRQEHFITTETLGYKMPKERSIDIDTPFDLVLLNAFLNSEIKS